MEESQKEGSFDLNNTPSDNEFDEGEGSVIPRIISLIIGIVVILIIIIGIVFLFNRFKPGPKPSITPTPTPAVSQMPTPTSTFPTQQTYPTPTPSYQHGNGYTDTQSGLTFKLADRWRVFTRATSTTGYQLGISPNDTPDVPVVINIQQNVNNMSLEQVTAYFDDGAARRATTVAGQRAYFIQRTPAGFTANIFIRNGQIFEVIGLLKNQYYANVYTQIVSSMHF